MLRPVITPSILLASICLSVRRSPRAAKSSGGPSMPIHVRHLPGVLRRAPLSNGGADEHEEARITTCCLDHPIGGMAAGTFCHDTEADCETILRASLDASITAAMITEGCTDYITQRSM